MDFNNRTISGASNSSDRLKKAIERNRAKVAKRTNQTSMFAGNNRSRPAVAKVATTSGDQSLSERLARLKQKRAQIQNNRLSGAPGSISQTTVQRNNPTSASKIEILKARRQKLQGLKKSAITEKTSGATGFSEKMAEKNFSFFNRIFSTAIKALLAKTIRTAIWMLNVFFLGIVIFGNRGVVDYVGRHGVLEEKNNHLKYLAKENEDIKFQIYRLQNDKTYQRQIIRDYLGYIAKDEYLVIFAENQVDNP